MSRTLFTRRYSKQLSYKKFKNICQSYLFLTNWNRGCPRFLNEVNKGSKLQSFPLTSLELKHVQYKEFEV